MYNSTSPKMKILITAPHAACSPDNPERHCDRLAKKTAEILALALRKEGAETTLLINETVLRSTLDLNREPSDFFTVFKKELTLADYLLDIHSFPILKEKVYLLDRPPFFPIKLPYVSFLAADLNYLIVTAKEVGVPAILIEFWEGLSDEMLIEECMKIAKTLTTRPRLILLKI